MLVWVDKAVVLAVHDEQLSEHGGLDGIRDIGALESALARPRNLDAYAVGGMFDLAAAYAFGIARNHPFVDGNKRTSFVVTELFLDLNQFRLLATDEEVVLTWLALAEGRCDEGALATWIRRHGAPVANDVDV